MSMLNITARLTCFTRQRTSQPSPYTATLTSSSIRTVEVCKLKCLPEAPRNMKHKKVYVCKAN